MVIQQSFLATLKLGAPFSLQTSGYLHQSLPSEPACDLLFCHVWQSTVLVPKHFKTHFAMILQKEVIRNAIVWIQMSFCLINIFLQCQFFKVLAAHLDVFFSIFLILP